MIEVHYAKAGPDDLLMQVSVTNAGPSRPTLHVLPTAWFRNTWSWDDGAPRPVLAAVGGRHGHDRASVPRRPRAHRRDRSRWRPCPRCCSARTRPTWRGCTASACATPYPKDGINDHVVSGAATVNPGRTGTKCAFWYQLTVAPGQTVELRLRLRPAAAAAAGARTRWGPSSSRS